MGQASLNDLAKVDFSIIAPLVGLNFTVRNYGSNATSIMIESPEADLNIPKIGALGDVLVNKSYKAQSKEVTLNVLRNSPDYLKLQSIVTAEEAGESVLMVASYINNNTKEKFISTKAFMRVSPPVQDGADVEDNVEYKLFLANVIHTPPTVS